MAGVPLAFLAREPRYEQTPETLTRVLYDSLSPEQKAVVCFDWNRIDPEKGLLRSFVANHWRVSPPSINSEFFSGEQRALIRDIFEGIVEPDWHSRLYQQLRDDSGGFGRDQQIAIFGVPGSEKFEFVLSGRHMTLRCDGDSADHVAFAGPIFYGHSAEGFFERGHHPGNVFWEQGLAANGVYEMLDGRQRELALITGAMPAEDDVRFRGYDNGLPGIPVTELLMDQKEELQRVLRKLLEPYRKSDRDEVVRCLNVQGGLDACDLSFYKQSDVGGDGVWDNWRLEGPAFVWYFRGRPHVHVWVHVADDPAVELNAHSDSTLDRVGHSHFP